MKFSFKRRPARPKPDADNNRPNQNPPLENAPIDINVPRECVCQSFAGEPGPCPRCKGPLRASDQTFMVILQRGAQAGESFMVGADDLGWFCAQCPTVVLNTAKLNEMFPALPPHRVGVDIFVTGLVNLADIPEDKQHLPVGSKGNPIPLVLFTNYDGAAIARGGAPSGRRRPKFKARRR